MRTKLTIAFVIAALLGQAHAQSPKSTIISNINGGFADNTAGAITAALLRSVTTEIVSSYVDWITCTASGGLVMWNGTSPTCLVKGTVGQVLVTQATTPTWENLANKISAGTGILITGGITPSIAVSGTIIAGGPTGSATIVPTITYNALGQLTQVSTATISASTLLDVIGSSQGGMIYRGSSGWAFLSPGTSGQVLTTGGAAANPSFTSVAGTGTVQSVQCGTGLTCNPSNITASGTISPTFASGPQYVANTGNFVLEPNAVWNSATITPLTPPAPSGTVTPDFSLAYNFSLAVTGNVVIGSPTNAKAGQTGCIFFTQGSGSSTGTVTFQTSSNWKFPGGHRPTATVTSNSIDALCYQARTATSIFANFINDWN